MDKYQRSKFFSDIEQKLAPHMVGISDSPLWDTFNRVITSNTNGFELSTKYPPHNVIKLSDTKYLIEIAIAGYSKEDIDVTMHNGVLSVSSTGYNDNDRIVGNSEDKTEEDNSSVEYLHKGISSKQFSKKFHLDEDVLVESARFDNGILTIGLKRVIPEEKKPKSVPID